MRTGDKGLRGLLRGQGDVSSGENGNPSWVHLGEDYANFRRSRGTVLWEQVTQHRFSTER